MTPVAAARLSNQRVTGPLETAHAVVSHLGAVQAQDYLGALWAVGLRTRDAVEGDVERALAERSIVRTWPMRGTLHFVAAEDARWLLELLAPRAIARASARHEREFGLTEPVLRRARAAVRRALEGGRELTREELYAALARARIRGEGVGLRTVWHLAHELLLCFGPRRGKQQTFVLFEEWLPDARSRDRDDALGELARRYFRGHGPASIADFIWWTGLTASDARRAIEIAGADVAPFVREGAPLVTKRRSKGAPDVHLLPPFDEFTVAYKDRSDVLDPVFAKHINAGGGIINAVIVIDGLVAGTWKRVIKGSDVVITPAFFRPLTAKELRGLTVAANRYARFLGLRAREIEAL